MNKLYEVDIVQKDGSGSVYVVASSMLGALQTLERTGEKFEALKIALVSDVVHSEGDNII